MKQYTDKKKDYVISSDSLAKKFKTPASRSTRIRELDRMLKGNQFQLKQLQDKIKWHEIEKSLLEKLNTQQ